MDPSDRSAARAPRKRRWWLWALLLAVPLLIATMVVLCGAIGILFPMMQNASSRRFYADVVRGPCPPADEFVGRWTPLPESINDAIANHADPVRTRGSYLYLGSNGEMELHDIPEAYFDGGFGPTSASPVTVSGRWAADSFKGQCDVSLAVEHGARPVVEDVWLERTNGQLRIDFIYSDPDLKEVMRYQHR